MDQQKTPPMPSSPGTSPFQAPVQEQGPAKHLLVITILVIALLVLGAGAFWMLSNYETPVPDLGQSSVEQTPTLSSPDDDSQAAIENDLQVTQDAGDLDKEFMEVDGEIQGL